jgi:hypothetical protein
VLVVSPSWHLLGTFLPPCRHLPRHFHHMADEPFLYRFPLCRRTALVRRPSRRIRRHRATNGGAGAAGARRAPVHVRVSSAEVGAGACACVRLPSVLWVRDARRMASPDYNI